MVEAHRMACEHSLELQLLRSGSELDGSKEELRFPDSLDVYWK